MAEATKDGGTTVDVAALVRDAVGEAMKGVSAALGEALKPIAENQKILADTLAAAPATAAAAAKDGNKAADAPKALTLDDVAKLLDQRLTAQQTSQQQTAQRNGYLETKLKDLPAAYRNQLGSDPTKWAAEEQSIRDAYKADFKTAGGTTTNVGGDKGGGAGTTTPAQTLDLNKLTPVQLIAQGLKSSQPQGPGALAAAGGAAAK